MLIEHGYVIDAIHDHDHDPQGWGFTLQLQDLADFCPSCNFFWKPPPMVGLVFRSARTVWNAFVRQKNLNYIQIIPGPCPTPHIYCTYPKKKEHFMHHIWWWQMQRQRQEQGHKKFQEECVNVNVLMYIGWNVLWLMTPTAHVKTKAKKRQWQNT